MPHIQQARVRLCPSRTWNLLDHHLEILPAVPHFFSPEAVIFVSSSTIFQLSGNVTERNRKQIVKLRTRVEQSYETFGKDTKKRTRLQNRYVLSFASDYESPFFAGSVHIRSDIPEKHPEAASAIPRKRRAKCVVIPGVELSCVLFSSGNGNGNGFSVSRFRSGLFTMLTLRQHQVHHSISQRGAVSHLQGWSRSHVLRPHQRQSNR